MAKFLRIEKEGKTCRSIGNKRCHYHIIKKCHSQCSALKMLYGETQNHVFIRDTIIPQKLALYEDMLIMLKRVHEPQKYLGYWSYEDMESIIDRAKKIEEV